MPPVRRPSDARLASVLVRVCCGRLRVEMSKVTLAGPCFRSCFQSNAYGRFVMQADPEIPDARASGFIFPIPAKSGFPISRIRDSGQIGMPDFPNPGFWPNRDHDPDFPESGIPAKSGFKSGKIPIFFEAARTVIAHCQRQASYCATLKESPQ